MVIELRSGCLDFYSLVSYTTALPQQRNVVVVLVIVVGNDDGDSGNDDNGVYIFFSYLTLKNLNKHRYYRDQSNVRHSTLMIYFYLMVLFTFTFVFSYIFNLISKKSTILFPSKFIQDKKKFFSLTILSITSSRSRVDEKFWWAYTDHQHHEKKVNTE